MTEDQKTYRVCVNDYPNDGKHYSAVSVGRRRWVIVYEGPDVNAVKKMVKDLDKSRTSYMTMTRGNSKSIKETIFKTDDESEDLGQAPQEPQHED